VKYFYFVSFQAVKRKSVALGSVEIQRQEELKLIGQIRELEADLINDNELDSCVVLSFQLLRTE
jgi:hypothetical protein